jgi:hypothetical protein
VSLWISVPILLIEVLCIAGLHWAEHDDDATHIRVGIGCVTVAAVAGAVLVLAWWRGW